MFPGLNDADCLAAGMRHRDLLAEATRSRSTRGRNLDRLARTRRFGAARHASGTLMARIGTRPWRSPEANETTAALGPTR